MATSEKPTDKHSGTKAWIKKWCHRLKPEHVDWANASDPSKRHNCMGFACGPVNGKLRWWQPPIVGEGEVLLNPTDYWPAGIPEGDDLPDFVRAAETVDFSLCAEGDEGWRQGHETIVIFYRNNDQKPFVHAAVCLESGRYLSKMADLSDFEHDLEAFDDVIHWLPVGRKYMRRAVRSSV